MVLYSFISDTGGSIVSKNVLLFRGCQECLECIEYLGLKIMEIKVNDTEIILLTSVGRRALPYLEGVVFRVLSCKRGIKFHYM